MRFDLTNVIRPEGDLRSGEALGSGSHDGRLVYCQRMSARDQASPRSGRRPRGSGSLYALAGGQVRAEITVLEDGDRRRIKRRFPTAEDAHRWLDEQVVATLGENSRQAQQTVIPARTTGTTTLLTYAQQWLASRIADGAVSPRVAANYRSSLRNSWGAIGGIPVGSVGRQNVRAFVAALAEPRPNGRVLSFASQAREWRLLHTVLRHAEREGLLPSTVINPADAPRRGRYTPTSSGREERVIPRDSYARLLSACSKSNATVCTRVTHRYGTCGAEWYLAIVTACRQGERTGLQRRDVALTHDPQTNDVVGGTLAIRRHAEMVAWSHGCGQSTVAGYPCGKKQAAACPDRSSEAQGGTAMALVPGTKSRRPDDVHVIPLDAVTAQLLDAHLQAMNEEGLTSPTAMLFGGVRLPRQPSRGKQQSDEVWTQKQQRWSDAVDAYRRDGATIRTPHQDMRAWRAVQDRVLPASAERTFGVHSIRHSTLTYLALNPAFSLLQLQALAHHADSRTTERYIALRGELHAQGLVAATTETAREYASTAFGVDLDATVLQRAASILEQPDTVE